MTTPRVTVPVDEQVIKRLQEEADHPGLGDSAMVFGPDLRALLRAYRSLSAALAPEGGAVLALGTPVEVEFSEAEVGKQTLYVSGVDMSAPGMTEPEYWLSETWPVKCRGDVSTDWKRDMFSALATLQQEDR